MVTWIASDLSTVNPLLDEHHYLGPIKSGGFVLVVAGLLDGVVVACQVWRKPTSRRLPSDGTWLELSRWCLTPDAGANAGSRNHRAAVRLLRPLGAKTLVSYSDPSNGHTGSLYRACNWQWAPTWHRLRPPPTGNGSWRRSGARQHIKDRWVFHAAKTDPARSLFELDDMGAVRRWQAQGSDVERGWAARSDYMRRYVAELAVAA